MSHEEITLEKIRYAAQVLVSQEVLQGSHLEARTDEITGDLMLRMRKDVLVDRVLDDKAEVAFVGTVRTDEVAHSVFVELPNPWWRRMLGLKARHAWALVVGQAAVITDDPTVRVYGTATVRAEYFRTFPEATVAYPDELGPVRMLVRTTEPYDLHTWPHRIRHATIPWEDTDA